MNKMNMIGMVLAGIAATLAALLVSGVGEAAAACVGKAVWYLPYASLVGGVGMLRAPRRVR